MALLLDTIPIMCFTRSMRPWTTWGHAQGPARMGGLLPTTGSCFHESVTTQETRRKGTEGRNLKRNSAGARHTLKPGAQLGARFVFAHSLVCARCQRDTRREMMTAFLRLKGLLRSTRGARHSKRRFPLRRARTLIGIAGTPRIAGDHGICVGRRLDSKRIP